MKITKRQLEYLEKNIEKTKKLELKKLKKITSNPKVLEELKSMLNVKLTMIYNENIKKIEEANISGLNGIKQIINE